MKEKNKKEQALEIQQCVCLFTCFCCSSFVRFLIHILLFTTPHTFHFLASPFFFSLFFSLLLFFIQCPSPYPPQPHTKHAVIAIAKKKKKRKTFTTTHHHARTHHTVPTAPSLPISPLQPTCVLCSCLVVLRVHLHCTCICRSQAGATKNKKQETKKEWSNECTAWLAQRAEMALGKAAGGAQHAQHAHTGMEG